MTNNSPYFIRDEEVPLDKLKGNPRNPRVHSEDEIKRLIESFNNFGTTMPMIVDEDYNIIAGHARLKAAKRAGLKTFPVRIFKFPEHLDEAYLIADNKLSEMSEWDNAELIDMFDDLRDAGVNLDITAFNINERDEILAEPLTAEPSFDGEMSEEKDFIIISFRMSKPEYENNKDSIEQFISITNLTPHIQQV